MADVIPPAWKIALGITCAFNHGRIVNSGIAAVTVTPIIFILINSLNVARQGESWRFGLEGWQEVFQSPRP